MAGQASSRMPRNVTTSCQCSASPSGNEGAQAGEIGALGLHEVEKLGQGGGEANRLLVGHGGLGLTRRASRRRRRKGSMAGGPSSLVGQERQRQVAEIDLAHRLEARQQERRGGGQPEEGVPELEAGAAAGQQDQVVGERSAGRRSRLAARLGEERPFGRDGEELAHAGADATPG
jgi:hypothetical protein